MLDGLETTRGGRRKAKSTPDDDDDQEISVAQVGFVVKN